MGMMERVRDLRNQVRGFMKGEFSGYEQIFQRHPFHKIRHDRCQVAVCDGLMHRHDAFVPSAAAA